MTEASRARLCLLMTSKDGRDEATVLRAPHLCRFSLNEQLHKAVEVRLKYFQRSNVKV